MGTLTMILIQVLFALVVVVGLMVWCWKLRGKYNLEARDSVQARVITEEGTGYTKRFPVVHGFITIPARENLNKPAMDYPVGEVATYLVDYPSGRPAFLQTKIRELILLEWCWEPLTNFSGDPILSPAMLHNIRREQQTAIATENARREAEEQMGRSGVFRPANMYWAIGLVGALVLGMGIWLYMQISNQAEAVDRLSKALGV